MRVLAVHTTQNGITSEALTKALASSGATL